MEIVKEKKGKIYKSTDKIYNSIPAISTFSIKKYAHFSISHNSLMEKQNLKQENFRLKQIIQSIANENLKLNDKINKYNQNLGLVDESLIIKSKQLPMPDTIKDKIAGLKQSIEKISKENEEYKILLSTYDTKGASRSKVLETKDLTPKKSEIDCQIEELTNEINDLKKKLEFVSLRKRELRKKIQNSENFIENIQVRTNRLLISHEFAVNITQNSQPIILSHLRNQHS